jgi:hypothetical protein
LRRRRRWPPLPLPRPPKGARSRGVEEERSCERRTIARERCTYGACLSSREACDRRRDACVRVTVCGVLVGGTKHKESARACGICGTSVDWSHCAGTKETKNGGAQIRRERDCDSNARFIFRRGALQAAGVSNSADFPAPARAAGGQEDLQARRASRPVGGAPDRVSQTFSTSMLPFLSSATAFTAAPAPGRLAVAAKPASSLRVTSRTWSSRPCSVVLPWVAWLVRERLR